jgi:2'-5' RNA ligase
MSTRQKYYAAAKVELPGLPPLHMTLAFMGADHQDWTIVANDLSDLPMPFEIRFKETTWFGGHEVVLVDCVKKGVEEAIREFHRKHVQSGHVSEKHLRMHVTAKGHADAILATGTYVVTQLYVKPVGGGKDEFMCHITTNE